MPVSYHKICGPSTLAERGIRDLPKSMANRRGSTAASRRGSTFSQFREAAARPTDVSGRSRQEGGDAKSCNVRIEKRKGARRIAR
jgi:hypothetical protein